MSPPPRPFEYPRARSGFGFSEEEINELEEEYASDDNDLADDASSLSNGNFSPPAWFHNRQTGERKFGNTIESNNLLGRRPPKAGDWRFGGYGTGGKGLQSRHISPAYTGDMSPKEVFEEARRTRLPTGSLSPEKDCTPERDAADEDATLIKTKSESTTTPGKHSADREIAERPRSGMLASMSPEIAQDNYIRFAVRADIQHRTEPIETAINFVRSRMRLVTKSWGNMVLATLVALVSMSAIRSLFQPMAMRPSPDLVKVAAIARSFEPLIYYSENGVAQVGDLQATGVAVWDLGESVRQSNMTSAPILTRSLDELSDSLKTLAIELTKFFANVDGDIDGILIVMDWARRELGQLSPGGSGSSGTSVPGLSTAFANMHGILCAAGLLEDPATGEPTRAGVVATALFGQSHAQRTRATLQRTFSEFLAVLEEAIESELQHSLALFALFEAVDRQFLNLARTVVRETSAQEEAHASFLSNLWTRMLGPKASEVKKYERNRELLKDVREKTVREKGILVEHNGRLLGLKANLESLRRKLVSPLVRSVNSSTLSLEEQIRGLEDVGGYLEGVRKRQKGKLLEMLYGGAPRGAAADGGRASISAGARLVEAERWDV
ncbi:hypothetical protein F4780DRAFT_771354 [Xylariomycetidae sp. FL0641]|nr:hypothetical protein F4780DRAFT_771354 [Xylariomycetidae sp. FL0641]